MHKKKMTVLAMASLMSLSLPLVAEESAGEAATEAVAAEAPAETAEPAAESAAPAAESAADSSAPAEAPAEPAGETTASGYDPMATMQDRLRERDARYEELKARAKEAGVMLPEDPPWKSAGMGMMPDMAERMQRHQAMMNMTPEERMAARESFYQEMQARAEERGIDLPDSPPWQSRAYPDDDWAKTQAVIDGMTPEERAACHAMHSRHMGMMRNMPQRPMGPGMSAPGMMGPGMMDQGWGPGAMGPGYGYGPNPYGPQNFWDPNR